MTTDLWHIVRLSIQAVILHLSPLHLLLRPVAGDVLLEGLAHQGCSEMAREVKELLATMCLENLVCP